MKLDGQLCWTQIFVLKFQEYAIFCVKNIL